MAYFFSMQYSAIQKTVLRHNRLWSIAGISQGLSRLNEIVLPRLARENGGEIMVAGGGKFTAFFADEAGAEKARREIIKQLAITFPMLEIQASDIVEAAHFRSRAAAGASAPSAMDQGIIDQLNEKKRLFRGYGTSFLPHLAVCEECGEFPAELQFRYREGRRLCRVCHEAWDWAGSAVDPDPEEHTTLEKIYAAYFERVAAAKKLTMLSNFEDLSPENEGEKRGRMAVWFSDLNNMNQKVPVWLDQDDDKVFPTFDRVKEANIDVVSEALCRTFSQPAGPVLPFRLVVAGGDDLCLVMAEEYVLDFARNLDQATKDKIEELDRDADNPLNMNWLREHARPDDSGEEPEIGPYSFGSGFIVTSINTPFQRIHELGEELMKAAKEATGRRGNSVNWRLMAEGEAVSDTLLEFERPLFIDEPRQSGAAQLSFAEYLSLRRKFSTSPHNISSSHRYAIISKLIELRTEGRQDDFENWLKCYDSSGRDKSFSQLLREPGLREGGKTEGCLLPRRVATLFELLGIKDGAAENQKNDSEVN